MRTRNIVLENFPEFELFTPVSKPEPVVFEPTEIDVRLNEPVDLRAIAQKKRERNELRRMRQVNPGLTEDDLDRARIVQATNANTSAAVNRATSALSGSLASAVSALPSDRAIRREATEFLDDYLNERKRNRNDDFGE